MRLLIFIDKNKFWITAFVLITVCMTIAISVLFFDNDYWETDWHWNLSFSGCFITSTTFWLKEEDW